MVGAAMAIAMAARTIPGNFIGFTCWVGDLEPATGRCGSGNRLRGLDTHTGGKSLRKVQQRARDVVQGGRGIAARRDCTSCGRIPPVEGDASRRGEVPYRSRDAFSHTIRGTNEEAHTGDRVHGHIRVDDPRVARFRTERPERQSSESSQSQCENYRRRVANGSDAAQLPDGRTVPSLAGLFTFNEGGTMSEYGIGPGVESGSAQSRPRSLAARTRLARLLFRVSPTTATTRAASSWVRRRSRPVWSSSPAAMSLRRGQHRSARCQRQCDRHRLRHRCR